MCRCSRGAAAGLLWLLGLQLCSARAVLQQTSSPTATEHRDQLPSLCPQPTQRVEKGYFNSPSNLFPVTGVTSIQDLYSSQGDPWKTTELFVKESVKARIDQSRQWNKMMLHFTAEGCLSFQSKDQCPEL